MHNDLKSGMETGMVGLLNAQSTMFALTSLHMVEHINDMPMDAVFLLWSTAASS